MEAVMEAGWVRRHISWRGELREGDHITARKNWNPGWARRIHKGDYAIAYTKNPADGGTPRAIIMLTHAPRKDGSAWVVRFEVVELITPDLDPMNGHHDFVGKAPACETCGFGVSSSWHGRDSDDDRKA